MAITRCPYCHAIIDENDKYCNNCGTQLLFTEDEELEEEIPGEKILDAEVEEKDYSIDEPKGPKSPAPSKDLDEEIGEELGDAEPAAAAADKEDEEEAPEEVILVDEIESAEAAGIVGTSGTSERTGLIEAEPAEMPPGPEIEEEDELEGLEEEAIEEAEEEDEIGEDELAEELEEEIEAELEKEAPAPREAVEEPAAAAAVAPPEAGPVEEPEAEPLRGLDGAELEYAEETSAPDESATAGEGSLRPVTFDSKEFEDLGKTVDLSRERIDKFIEVLAAKESGTGPLAEESAPAATPAPVSASAPASIPAPGPSPAPGPAVGATPEPSTGTLPPWASVMKGAPVFSEEAAPAGSKGPGGAAAETPESEEIEIFPRRRGSDSTIGLPEKVGQAPLPFEAPPTPSEEGADEMEDVEEIEPEEAPTAEAPAAAPSPAKPSRGALLAAGETAAAETARTVIELAGEVEEPTPQPPFSFSVFFKSKAFDVLFVGLFWLVALWLAASSMGQTLFEILGSMSGAMLLLYAVFVLLYFFLFRFFLGETLGDRLFRPRE